MKIISTIKTLPAKAYNGINDLGRSAIDNYQKSCAKLSKNPVVQKAKEHKETIVGSALILIALSGFIKLISAINNKIKQVKNDRYYN